jgi:isocitrate dehydrogenase
MNVPAWRKVYGRCTFYKTTGLLILAVKNNNGQIRPVSVSDVCEKTRPRPIAVDLVIYTFNTNQTYHGLTAN